ncbi:cysteine hydrolase family protein [Halarcobacter anaerophilus]|uniref:Isochorismatase n=1 Tax=Halarcobacter anaerophilus TaxID=877500 RepID=A0A4Q0XZG4_9BACT|nr:cysteine hydrolase family protein [Halarcobacter anaerophilus]QDF30050.1 cysteine hydrolase [Halarcobacter anaerophilus]RXJ63096.1 isochorismatase [Halarcobacter anaerophilus]
MGKKALLLVDFQNDYFSSFEGSKFPLNNCEKASSNASKILEEFRNRSLDIIHIRHENSNAYAPFFKAASTGADIHKSVEPLKNELVITKSFPNSFLQTKLKEYLDEKGINSLIIVGAMTHMCVDATVRAAKDFGYNCTVVNDACATKDLEFEGEKVSSSDVQRSFMAAFEFAYAKVENTENFLKGFDT